MYHWSFWLSLTQFAHVDTGPGLIPVNFKAAFIYFYGQINFCIYMYEETVYISLPSLFMSKVSVFLASSLKFQMSHNVTNLRMPTIRKSTMRISKVVN